MLSATGFLPSSPLLLASVNKDHRSEVEATEQALEHVADEWYAKRVETVMIITQSRFAYEDSVSIDVADPYTMNLASLGDLSPQAKYHPDFALIDGVQRIARNEGVAFTLSTEPGLPFGCAAPLRALTRRIPHLRIVPISPGNTMDGKELYQTGILLKHAIENSPKRIGVLAVGDVSLAHLANIQLILEEKSTASLINIAPELKDHNDDAAYRPLTMLFGILDNTPARAEILSVESPFDVGYVVATFT
jgi:aromatic ring-opening dioxygenase LigB subunit